MSWHWLVDRRAGPFACWPWTGGRTGGGYGRVSIRLDGRWRGAGAHQVAHYLATGRWERRANGRLVRHLCHNRLCCNPRHLRGGSPLDNAFDRAQRARGVNLLQRDPLLLRVAGVAR